MKKPALISEINEPKSAVLIVDKIGVVGEKLAEEFSKDFYVVLFSGRISSEINKRISFVNFKNKIPKVPQNRYSKIFLIDDGKSITKESSFSFIKEAKRLSADFYFLGSVRNFDIKHTDELVKIYDNTKVLVFGDLFDKEFLFDHDASITKFILEAGNRKRIKVPGEGLSFSYPISFEDTIKLILKAVYLKIPQKIILLFYETPITDISLAHLFQKIDPEIKVDFEKEYRIQNFFIPQGSEFAISKYDLKKKIEELDLNKPKTVLNRNLKIKKNNLKFFKTFGVGVLLLLFLAALPLLATYLYLNLGEKQLKSAIEQASVNEFSEAQNKTNNANSFFNTSRNANLLLMKQLSIFNKNDRAENINIKINNGLYLTKTLDGVFGSAQVFKEIYNKTNINPNEDFRKSLQMIRSSYIDLEKLNFDSSYENLDMMISSVGLLAKVSDVLPDVLGFDNEKTYLVLFQDSSELRPGGGKITSVAKLRIEKGSVLSFEIFDTKELDEKLEIHIEPPYAIRRYLPSTDYFLKDSNFNPDFVESAITASTIYNIESGDQVDGVIGVDLYFMQNLLEKIGPIYIKEVGKNITSENIHQVSFEFDDEKYFDSFTTMLLKNIKLNLSQKNEPSPFLILEVIDQAVKEKHMLFAFKDNNIQNVFITNNLAGSLVDNRNISKNKINDIFGFFEANLGLNKINYFISRSVSKKNIIEKNGDMASEVLIAFKNSSKRGSSFAKTYKNYMQVVLPSNAKISQVSVAGKRQDLIPAISDYKIYENPRFIDPKELEMGQVSDSNKSIFGFLISVDPDSIQTIKLNYTLPFKISTSEDSLTNYSLLIFKQPGIDSFPFNLVFEDINDFLILPENSYSLEIKNDEIIESTISKNTTSF